MTTCTSCGKRFALAPAKRRSKKAPQLCGSCALKKANDKQAALKARQTSVPPTPRKSIIHGKNPIPVGTAKKTGPSMDVEHSGGDMFRVKSESSDTYYTVDMGVPNCTCVDWKTKRNKLVSAARKRGEPDESVVYECKHIRQVRLASTTPIPDAATQKKSTVASRKKQDIVSRFKAKSVPGRAKNMLAELEEVKKKL